MYFPYSNWSNIAINSENPPLTVLDNLYLWTIADITLKNGLPTHKSGTVNFWPDLSKNGRHLVNQNYDSGNSNPVLSGNQINGHSALVFYNNGSTICNALAYYPSGSSFTNNQWTIYTVALKRSNDESIGNYFSTITYISDIPLTIPFTNAGRGTNSYMTQYFIDNNENGQQPLYIVGEEYNGDVILSGSYNTWAITVTKNDFINQFSSAGYWQSGVGFQTGLSNAQFGFSANAIVVGQGPCMGSTAGDSTYYGLNGSIAEIIIYNKLTDNTIAIGGTGLILINDGTEDSQIMYYLRKKYNL